MKLVLLGVYILLVFGYVEARPRRSILENIAAKKCGYESCPIPDPNKLNVHIVPHTHDDVGWLKTVDQYYYGSETLIQKAGVQYIIDSVVQELLKDPKKKFIYVESAFFFQWWREQSEELQEQVKELVNQGRLEFIGGAWSMNDEATTHYQSIIDQFAWGLRRLNDTFGECARPRIGWQIDPFGHSREQASIFANMGFDGLFFGRLDYQDKQQRLITKTPEMIWNASPNLGEAADLFTGALYNQYQPPPGFCFDILCADEPIIDRKHSPDNNVKRRVDEYLAFIDGQRKFYRTNNIILTMGGDFTYMDANVYYKNLDKLIRYANERQKNGSDVNLFYSTPSCYLKALHDSDITWPTKQDDFFPYGSDPHSYWTGYFISRPTLKRYERVGNHFLQICKQLTALAPIKENHFEPHLTFLRETMGIMQHHDAVTGTEKQKVAYDYARRLDVGLRACGANTKAILNNLVTGKENRQVPGHGYKIDYTFDFNTCSLLNISQCEISEENDQFIVTLYNPLAHSIFDYIRLPVSEGNYVVKDYRGIPAPSQLVPIAKPVQDLNFRKSNSTFELVYLASELPPLGYKSYYITKEPDSANYALDPEIVLVGDDPDANADSVVIGNKYISLTFNANGLLSSVASNGVTRKVAQEFFFYEGAAGDNKVSANRSSGAYIFRPNSTERIVATRANIQVVRGPLVEEVHQIFNDWISQVVRVYKEENLAEFEWLVGPIPIDDKIGKEVVSKFTSDIDSKEVFFTDSNGREMIKRVRNHRDTWQVNLQEKIAGNYYPITTKIAIEDDNARMAILVDRAQGGSSLQDGAIEIMVHRRLLRDDAFGVGEALNETAYGKGLVACGKHYLIVGPSRSQSPTTQAQERFVQVKKLLPPWLFLSNAQKYPFNEWKENYSHIYSGIRLSLPQNVHLMTFEPWHEDEVLIRFEHILEKDEDPEYSKPVTFNLRDVLRDLDIIDIRETTLDGNQWLEETKRLKFKPDPEGTVYEQIAYRNELVTAIDGPVSKRSVDVNMLDMPNLLTSTNVFEGYKKRNPRSVRIIETEETTQENGTRARNIADQLGEYSISNDDSKYIITVKPMQIRTFVLLLEQKI